MQQALTSPVYRSIAVGGLLLALSLAYGRPAHRPRLVLHAASNPHAIYLTAWRDGDVQMNVEPGSLEPLMFTTKAWVNDGCRWLGIETLDPLGPRVYAYRYDEIILGCNPGAVPYWKTPRTGTVTVED